MSKKNGTRAGQLARSIRILVVLLVSFVGLVACSGNMDEQERANVELVHRVFDEVWSNGNLGVVDEIFADEYVKHWGAYRPTVGKDELKTHVTNLRSSFPDWNERVDDIHASGDMVFARWTESGTFTNEFYGMAPTNKHVSAAGMGWIRISGGRIVEEWTMVDNWGTQSQINVTYPDAWLVPGWQ